MNLAKESKRIIKLQQSGTDKLLNRRLPAAAFNLADMYEHGKGVLQSDIQAMSGKQDCCGWRIRKGTECDRLECTRMEEGVKRTKNAAFECINVQRSRDSLPLNSIWETCTRMDAEFCKMTDQAIAWYHKAAEQGHALSQLCVATMYENGRGVRANDDRAFLLVPSCRRKWKRRSPERTWVDVQQRSRSCEDEVEAAKLVFESCETRTCEWRKHLASMYLNGEGVQKSERWAAECFAERQTKEMRMRKIDLG